MAAFRPKVSMIFLVGMFVCLILVKQVHAMDQPGHNIHVNVDLANEDADDSRNGHIGNLKKFGDEDSGDDVEEVTVLGH